MRAIILQASTLRGQGRFDEALVLIEQHLDSFDPDIRVIGLREGFLAAHEAGYNQKAERFAKEIAEKYPELPTIQSYLLRYRKV